MRLFIDCDVENSWELTRPYYHLHLNTIRNIACVSAVNEADMRRGHVARRDLNSSVSRLKGIRGRKAPREWSLVRLLHSCIFQLFHVSNSPFDSADPDSRPEQTPRKAIDNLFPRN